MPLLKSHPLLSAIQLFSQADKDYLAYRVGLSLVEDSSFPGSIQKAASSITVGSFTDTYDDAAIGTPRTTQTSVITTLYSNDSATNESVITNLNQPIRFDKVSKKVNVASKLGTDSDIDLISGEILSNIMLNEYPGTFRLGYSSPGADWSIYVANVFVDNLIDNSVSYNIYRRDTITAPPKAAPLKFGYSGANPVSLLNMSDSDITDVFATRVKNKVLSSGVGKYQLRTDVQGAPVDPGTWAVRGTATDTINNITGQNFVGPSTAQYELISDYTVSDVNSFTLTEDLPFDQVINYTWDVNFTSIQPQAQAYLTIYEGGTAYVSNPLINYLMGDYINASSYSGPLINYTNDAVAGYIAAVPTPTNFAGPGVADSTNYTLTNYTGAAANAANYTGPDVVPTRNYTTIFTGAAAYDRIFTGPGSPQPYLGPLSTLYTREFLGRGPDVNYSGIAVNNETYLLSAVYADNPVYSSDLNYTGPALAYENISPPLTYSTDAGVNYLIQFTSIGAGAVAFTLSLQYQEDVNYTGLTDTITYLQDLIYNSPTNYTSDTGITNYSIGEIAASSNYGGYISNEIVVLTYTLYCRVS